MSISGPPFQHRRPSERMADFAANDPTRIPDGNSAMVAYSRTRSAVRQIVGFVRGAVKRREFITLLGGAAAWPIRADAETSRKRPLIAVLSAITRVDNSPLTAFVDGLKDLGYVEGQNVEIVYRFAEEHLDRFPTLAAEVVALEPDVILGERFRSSNHIMRPCRACRSMCERPDRC